MSEPGTRGTGPVLVLVGPPGAGKSTVGQLVADALQVGFRDTDDDVEVHAGKAVADIFYDDGESAFRALEQAAVARALAEHDGVLALGGGAVLDPATRALLGGQHVVFLEVGLADAATRVGMNVARPLLIGNPRAQLKTLMDQRRPVYEQVAEVVVETSGRTADEVAADVLALVHERTS